MQPRIVLSFALPLALLGALGHASAQSRGFAVDMFHPAERGSDWFVSDSLDLRGSPNVAAGVVVDWSYQPLVLRRSDATGKLERSVITDRVTAHPGLSFMFRDRLRVALDLPLVLFQSGQDTSALAPGFGSLSKTAVGDVRLAADVRLFGRYGDVVTAALGAQLHLPSGSQAQLTSDGTLRFTPRLLLAGDGEGFTYAAQLGYAYRPLDGSFAGRQLGSEVVFSLAGGVRVNDMFVFGPELYGSNVVTDGVQWRGRGGTPLELLLGLHVRLAKHWQFGSAIGPGLNQGDGSSSMRLVFSVELAPDVCVDPDGDGICEPLDACPSVAGKRTGERRTTGCPTVTQPEAPEGVAPK